MDKYMNGWNVKQSTFSKKEKKGKKNGNGALTQVAAHIASSNVGYEGSPKQTLALDTTDNTTTAYWNNDKKIIFWRVWWNCSCGK